MNAPQPSTKLYYRIWIALLLLLLLTWGVARFNFGRWNTVAAMTVSVVKMLLVVLYFMHARYSTRFTWVLAAAGFFWLFFMITLTMMDYLTRGGLPF